MVRAVTKHIGRLFRRASRTPRRFETIAARYDAAQTTAENARHWSNADALSARAANSPDVRRKLRNRSRYEVANNSYAEGVVDTLAVDLIGRTGPRLALTIPGDAQAMKAAAALIRQRWQDWCDDVNLPRTLRLLHRARVVDGEAFALLKSRRRTRWSPIQLLPVPIEADLVHDPAHTGTDPTNIDGVIVDDTGEPVAYSVLRQHPGDRNGLRATEADIVPADRVLRWVKIRRPGQVRGVPDITPALPLFAQLRRYTLAVVAAAETAADFAIVLQTNGRPGEPVDEVDEFLTWPIEPRMLTSVPYGWQANQLKPEQPTTTYDAFCRALLREIGRCLSMPYSVVAGDSSQHNYASGRLDWQVYAAAIDSERDDLAIEVLDRLFLAWLDEAALLPGFLPPGLPPFSEWRWNWIYGPREHVDPLKEATAQATRLANNTTTLAAEYAARGEDWEAALEQRAAERAKLRELGLSEADATTVTAAAIAAATKHAAEDLETVAHG